MRPVFSKVISMIFEVPTKYIRFKGLSEIMSSDKLELRKCLPPTFFIPEHEDIVMEFVKIRDPPVSKPIMIAAMQDMGNVGSIA
ncbi:MAG: hypothetical protein ACREBU_26730, partial [Nitrososphaera sp.]